MRPGEESRVKGLEGFGSTLCTKLTYNRKGETWGGSLRTRWIEGNPILRMDETILWKSKIQLGK